MKGDRNASALGFRPKGVPLVAPAYDRGPYRFRGTRALMLVGPITPATARAALPEPLELLEDSLVIWTLMDCPDVTGIGPHNCACPAIPCRYGDQIGQFVPFLLTSTEASLLCFREVHGWGAMLGETAIQEDGGHVTGTVSRNGARIARMSATIGGEVIREIPKTPTFLYKEIPSIDTESCDISRLIATTSLLENMELRSGSGEIFPAENDHPLTRLAPSLVTQALYGSWDDIYPETAKILHEYS